MTIWDAETGDLERFVMRGRGRHGRPPSDYTRKREQVILRLRSPQPLHHRVTDTDQPKLPRCIMLDRQQQSRQVWLNGLPSPSPTITIREVQPDELQECDLECARDKEEEETEEQQGAAKFGSTGDGVEQAREHSEQVSHPGTNYRVGSGDQCTCEEPMNSQ